MMHPRVKDYLATIATDVYHAGVLLEQVEEIQKPLNVPEDLQCQLRLLHVGLDIAYNAIENPAIGEIIKDDDRPF